LKGVPLITRAIRKCIEANCFDEIYVNSEDEALRSIVKAAGVQFYQRPDMLVDNNATSEDYITDFLRGHDCDHKRVI
jgi:CMP-N-acetylneuraminic acid synthetase